jgi:hypothetical protein
MYVAGKLKKYPLILYCFFCNNCHWRQNVTVRLCFSFPGELSWTRLTIAAAAAIAAAVITTAAFLATTAGWICTVSSRWEGQHIGQALPSGVAGEQEENMCGTSHTNLPTLSW